MRRRLFFLLLSVIIYQLSAQVRVAIPTDVDYTTSYLLAVYDDDTQIATICREYIVDPTHETTEIADVLYLSNPDGSTNYARGYSLSDARHYIWDLESNQCTALDLDTNWKGLYITPSQQVSYTSLANARVATTKPIQLIDQRGDESLCYGIVKVGAQLWMRENLYTLRWRDGSEITTGLTKEAWWKTEELAACYYKDDAALLSSHGGLYNHYAVVDARGLAPQGWIIASDELWKSMIRYVDPQGFEPNPDDLSYESENAGLLLKSTDGWKVPPSPEPGATLKQGNNKTGFNARPMGSTSESKYLNYYSAEGFQAYFWTSSLYDKNAIFRRFYWDSDIANKFYGKRNYGYSVRCMCPATQVEIIDPTQHVVEGVQIQSLIDPTTSFTLRAASKSGQIEITDAAESKLTFTVDRTIDLLTPGAGTLITLPASVNNENLSISGELLYLDLSGQKSTDLKIGQMDLLKALILNDNQLASLRLPALPALKMLSASSNKLSKLTLRDCPSLTEISAVANKLSDLSLANCPKLDRLEINNNLLSNPLPLVESLPIHSDIIANPGHVIFLNTKGAGNLPEGNIKSDTLIIETREKGWLILDGETELSTRTTEITHEHALHFAPTSREGCYEIVGVIPSFWSIYSTAGALLSTSLQTQEHGNMLDLSDLPCGIYIVHLIDVTGISHNCRVIR